MESASVPSASMAAVQIEAHPHPAAPTHDDSEDSDTVDDTTSTAAVQPVRICNFVKNYSSIS
jgi:hypothetical protein